MKFPIRVQSLCLAAAVASSVVVVQSRFMAQSHAQSHAQSNAQSDAQSTAEESSIAAEESKQAGANSVVANKVEVPVKAVSLFSSGVGFFQHTATVTGDATSELIFQTEQVNDILKSLVLQDLSGGSVGTVSYPSLDPLGKTLSGFAINLTSDPSMAGVLAQVRGASVNVETTAGDKLTGTVLGVETRQVVAKENSPAVAMSFLNLVTATGLRSVRVDDTRSIQLSDVKLQEELTKALSAVARARDEGKKAIRFEFAGKGERQVKIGYVVQTPVWKTSYRLVLDDKDEKKASLQGWAIVENQTDNDWNDIQLNLVSGRPLSFVMDLYQPMYLDRPIAVLESFAGLRPQVYRDGVMADAEANQVTSRNQRSRSDLKRESAPASRSAAPAPGAAFAGEGMTQMNQFLDPTASISTQASAGQIGELFQYTVGSVTLARQSSAMIPIVTDPVDIKKLSIFNPAVHSTYPLTGARVTNTTGKHLLQGPITVFGGQSYAGDAQINNVPPGQARLLSYGIDLQTLVDSSKVQSNQRVVSAKIVKGTLELSINMEDSRTYLIKSKSTTPKTVLIESPRLSGYELFETDKPSETTDTVHRFEVELPAAEKKELVVKQRLVVQQSVSVIDANIDTLLLYSRTGTIAETVRDQLAKVVQLQSELFEVRDAITKIDGEFTSISQDQERLRQNMRTVDKNTDYYQRLLKRLDEQETMIDQGRVKREGLAADLEKKQQQFDEFVSGLSVE